MFGVQFEDVAGSAQSIRIDKVITSGDLKTSTSWGAMDQIWKWDVATDNWAFYGYYTYDDSGDEPLAAWHRYNKTTGVFTPITDADVLTSGDGFYFYNAQSSKKKTITLAGGVKPLSDTKVYTIAGRRHNVIAYPWPVDIKITDIPKFYTGASTPKTSTSWGAMDQIWCWDYTKDNWAFYGYYTYDDSGDEPLSDWYKYNKTEGTFTKCTDADVIPAGSGFYFFNAHASKAKTITFTYPVPEDK